MFVAKSFVGLLVLATLASAQEEALGPNGQPKPEPYSFSYSADSAGALSSHQETGDGTGRITGVYTIAGPDGRERRVEYIADAGGYRATVKTNEIGTKPEDSGDARFQVSQPSEGQLAAAAAAGQQPQSSRISPASRSRPANSNQVVQEQIPLANNQVGQAIAPAGTADESQQQQTLVNLDDIQDQPPQQLQEVISAQQLQQPQGPLPTPSFQAKAPIQPALIQQQVGPATGPTIIGGAAAPLAGAAKGQDERLTIQQQVGAGPIGAGPAQGQVVSQGPQGIVIQTPQGQLITIQPGQLAGPELAGPGLAGQQQFSPQALGPQQQFINPAGGPAAAAQAAKSQQQEIQQQQLLQQQQPLQIPVATFSARQPQVPQVQVLQQVEQQTQQQNEADNEAEQQAPGAPAGGAGAGAGGAGTGGAGAAAGLQQQPENLGGALAVPAPAAPIAPLAQPNRGAFEQQQFQIPQGPLGETTFGPRAPAQQELVQQQLVEQQQPQQQLLEQQLIQQAPGPQPQLVAKFSPQQPQQQIQLLQPQQPQQQIQLLQPQQPRQLVQLVDQQQLAPQQPVAIAPIKGGAAGKTTATFGPLAVQSPARQQQQLAAIAAAGPQQQQQQISQTLGGQLLVPAVPQQVQQQIFEQQRIQAQQPQLIQVPLEPEIQVPNFAFERVTPIKGVTSSIQQQQPQLIRQPQLQSVQQQPGQQQIVVQQQPQQQQQLNLLLPTQGLRVEPVFKQIPVKGGQQQQQQQLIGQDQISAQAPLAKGQVELISFKPQEGQQQIQGGAIIQGGAGLGLGAANAQAAAAAAKAAAQQQAAVQSAAAEEKSEEGDDSDSNSKDSDSETEAPQTATPQAPAAAIITTPAAIATPVATPIRPAGRLVFGKTRFGAPAGTKIGTKIGGEQALIAAPQPLAIPAAAPQANSAAAVAALQPVRQQPALQPIKTANNQPQFASFGTRLGTKG